LCAVACSATLGALVRADEPKVDAESKKVLDSLGAFYSKLEGFQVDVNVALTIEQQGLKQSQDFKQKFGAERPNKLSYALDSGPLKASVVSDGKELSVYFSTSGKYAVEPAPESWTKLFENPVVLGSMGVGNAGGVMMALLSKDPGGSLLEGTSSVEYGGLVELGDTKCHWLKATQEDFDWQVWIDAGEQPLVRQFVPNLQQMFAKMAKQNNQPALANTKIENVVTYKEWKLDPKFEADAFVFHTPEDATKVDTLLEIFGAGAATAEPHALLGKDAPPIELELLDGGKLDLASFKDKNVVILDFWATWCGPCVQAMPIIDAVAEKYKDKGVKLFAVNLQEGPDEIKEFLKNAELEVPVALDTEGAVAKAYLADAIPQTVIVGKNGTVQVVTIGLVPNLAESLTKDLDALLEGKDLAAETLAKAKKQADDKPAGDASPEEKDAPAKDGKE
jgi:thiol-disulfide isomerase/thioredoxin